jgi:hypothetical protein
MARRNLIPVNIMNARQKAAQHLRELMSNYDIAEFQAQTHAADMVNILAGFARDPTRPDDFRRTCANDVLNRAYGTPAIKATVLQLDPASAEAHKIGGLIDQSRETADMLQLIDAWAQVPYDRWPETVKEQTGEFGKAWGDQQQTGIVIDQEK